MYMQQISFVEHKEPEMLAKKQEDNVNFSVSTRSE